MNKMRLPRRFLVFLLFLVWGPLDASSFTSIDTLVAKGDDALSMGDNAQAISSYQSAIEELQRMKSGDSMKDVPLVTVVSLLTNLATAYSALGQNEPAADFYQKALMAYNDGVKELTDEGSRKEVTSIAVQSAFFLGMVYQDMGQSRDAVDAYRYTTSLDPLNWASFANMGSVYQDYLSVFDRALEAYNEAYALLTASVEPTDPPDEPQYVLSQLQYRIGLCISADPDRKCAVQNENGDTVPGDCKEFAAHAFSLAVQYDSSNTEAKRMLATITADATMKRADSAHVQTLFDDYAENFEHSLVEELGYNGYERLRWGFDRFMTTIDRKDEVMDFVVDAGCGTGLVGEQFRNVSKTLIGVDLSDAIIAQAKEKRPGLYEETRVGDVLDVFAEMAGRISLILAGDAYIYFGDLVPLFQAMHKGLRPGGFAAFTLENVSIEAEETLTATKPDWRWQLTASGRFAHRRTYVEAVSLDSQLKVVHYEPLDDFRFEKGTGVRGHLFIVQKIAPEGKDEL